MKRFTNASNIFAFILMSFAVFLNVLAHRKSLINFVLASHVLTFNLLITSISQLKCVCTYSTLVHSNKLYTNRY